ncbi:MAG: hypothetical protein AB7O78_19620, partial [Thermoleophilia bacterium]
LLAASSVAGTGIPSESGFVQAFWIGAAGAVVAAVAAMCVGPRRARRETAPAPSVLAADRS